MIFNLLFKYLLTSNQSSSRHSNSYVHQLLLITHEIYKACDANLSLNVTDTFMDLSKTFDRVWHDDLMHKSKCLGICVKDCQVIHSFIPDWYQKKILNSQSSNWSHINAGVSQGSVLTSFLDISKIWQTSYFEYFKNVWSCLSSIMIV